MKILIADPHPEVQAALQLILQRAPEASQVSLASSPVQLLALCAQDCPDLVLFDLHLAAPTRSQAMALRDFVRVLRRLCPHCQLVVMSSRFEAEPEALAAGANGFISKTAPPDEVLSTLRGYFNRPAITHKETD